MINLKSKVLWYFFEYAWTRTPQRNRKMERILQTFYGRVRAMLSGAGLQEEITSVIWDQCASTDIYYSKILATRVTKRFPQETIFGKEAH
jgi:hypothetical protein